MINKFEFTVNEFYSNLVSFESLYGIYCSLPSLNFDITFENWNNDLFIWAVYWLDCYFIVSLYEPAKSTTLILLLMQVSD